MANVETGQPASDAFSEFSDHDISRHSPETVHRRWTH
jgi:hypothetical protein